MKETTQPEWSHKLDTREIAGKPLRTSISASPQARKDLARRVQVEEIKALQADLVLERVNSNLFLHITGAFKADVVQLCVVSGEPVEQTVEADIDAWFADQESAVSITKARRDRQGKKSDAELEVLDEKDDPEPMIDGQVDLGELVTQHLSLAIDPYPRAEGAAYENHDGNGKKGGIPETRKNPFAALQKLKKTEDAS